MSRISLILSSIILVCSGLFFYPKWEKNDSEAQISWDAGGYYWYLPAYFIYDDLKEQAFKEEILQKYTPIPPHEFQYAFKDEHGNYVMKYTLGIALLESPFFGAAHIYAQNTSKYPADGFSRPYQVAVYMGGIFYTLIGLFFFRRVLLSLFSERWAAVGLLLLVLGTNYLNYAGIEVGMTHGWLFTFNTLILYHTIKFYNNHQYKYIIFIAFWVGIATLIRPTEIIAIIIPLLWGITQPSKKNILNTLSLFKKYLKTILIGVFITFSIVSLQFLYWKYASGQWLVYSYQDQGFNWLKPWIKTYAFNYQTGWMTYTPLMLLLFLGIPNYWNKGHSKWAVLGYAFLFYYIMASWSLWDIGGRGMIQSYPILMIIIVQLLKDISYYKWLKVLIYPIIGYGIFFNLWWTYHAHYGSILSSVPSNKVYFYKTLFKGNIPEQYQFLRDHQEIYEEEISEPEIILQEQFDTPKVILKEQGFFEKYSIHMIEGQRWLRLYFDVSIDDKEWNVWNMTLIQALLLNQGQEVKSAAIRAQRLLNGNDRKGIYFDMNIKELSFDEIELRIFNSNDGYLPFYLYGIEVVSH